MRIYSDKDKIIFRGGEFECNISIDDTKAYREFCYEKRCDDCLCFRFQTAYRSDKIIIGGTYLILDREENEI